jgi:hypothetical protein
MPYRLFADAIVIFHLTFVGFVIFGGILVVRWPRMAFAHLPAAVWGVFIEWSGLLCPLTIIENQLRDHAGDGAYQGAFVDHYVMPVLYPEGLTRNIQYILGGGILILNLTLYFIVLRRLRHRKRALPGSPVTALETGPDQPAHRPQS